MATTNLPKTAKCPQCGKTVRVTGQYKNGDLELQAHERPAYKGRDCSSHATRRELGMSELPQD